MIAPVSIKCGGYFILNGVKLLNEYTIFLGAAKQKPAKYLLPASLFSYT
jgi:hypothetical protein